MYEEAFYKRLAQLRLQKNVSARDMSLKIGQNPGYINSIETGKALPSMAGFFYICDYLTVTPQQFFEFDYQCPAKVNNLVNNAKKLSPEELDHLKALVRDLTKQI